MHQPPDGKELYDYADSNRVVILSLGLSSSIILLIGGLLFARSQPEFYIYGIYVLMIAVYLGFSYFVGIFGRDFSWVDHSKVMRSNTVTDGVDILLPTCGEDLDILENTFTAVKNIEWHADILVTVLDDSGRDSVKELAEKFNFQYFSRPIKTLKKAGNIRYGFQKTNKRYFAIFDADFAPRPDFLQSTMPYFGEASTGIVQTPQYFALSDHSTVIGKGAAYVQELFYRLIQVSRDAFRAPICVGTNAVYRRAIFEDLGGTFPIDYSEDVHTGFYTVAKGFRVRYLPLNLAKGMCPETHQSFFTQQYRWAMGSITLCMNPWFWSTKLKLTQRICYLSGIGYYITTGVSVLFISLPSMIMVNFYPDKVLWFNYMFSVPSFLFTTLIWGYWSRHKFGIYALAARQIQYWAHLFAIVDKLRGNLMPWQATGAIKSDSKNERFVVYKKASFTWAFLQFIPIILGIIHNHSQYGIDNFGFALFFACFNFAVAMYAWGQK